MTILFSTLNLCPVCGYHLRRPPIDSDICWCCGTQFGYNDSGRSHEELRDLWIQSEMPWESAVHNPPYMWNPLGQLISAGYMNLTTEEKSTANIPPTTVWDTKLPYWAFSAAS
jgi:hypothetical protein